MLETVLQIVQRCHEQSQQVVIRNVSGCDPQQAWWPACHHERVEKIPILADHDSVFCRRNPVDFGVRRRVSVRQFQCVDGSVVEVVQSRYQLPR